MASPRTTIADAFEKLRRSVSEEDAHDFASTDLRDVWTAVHEIQSEQRKRRHAQNLNRMKPFLDGIEKYAGVIDTLCNGTPFLSYVWAPIKMMLQLAKSHRDIFEALLAAYAEIGSALPRFDRYERAFKENLEFQSVLASVYCNILDFHQRAYKFFKRRAWHIIFLSTWQDFGRRFEGIISSLKASAAFVDTEAASIDIVEAKDSRVKTLEYIQQRQRREKETLEEDEKKAKNLQIRHSIEWLSVDEHVQDTEYERTARPRHDKTCEWIENDPRMKAWKEDDGKRPVLWLNGKPGAGKSVMCSYIIKTLMETPNLTCCYYFARYSGQDQTGSVCQQILATIIRQLITQHPDICTLIANKYAYSGMTSSMASLRTLVPLLLELVPYTRIIIDGIDEISKMDQKSILKELQTICNSPAVRTKVLFSSRGEKRIYKRLSTQPQILLDECQEVNLDIQCFVEYKMTKLQTSDQNLRNKIKSILIERANGMFLWVRLVIDELRYFYNDVALEETAETLPKGLREAYDRILDRIMSREKSKVMAIRILGWMACSYRLLKKYEILDGIAFNFANTVLSPKTKIRAEALDLCRPLIEDGPDNTIDFVHFSVKEYILDEEYQAKRPFVWRESAHLDISFSCIAFLNTCIPLLPTSSTNEERATLVVRGFHGLCNYANNFWFKHLLAYCSYLDQQQSQMSVELMSQLQVLLRFTKETHIPQGHKTKNGITRDLSKTPGLQVLSHYPDIKGMVMQVLSFRARATREDSSGKNPETISLDSCDSDHTYFSTVRHYYQQTVEFLLDNQAVITYPRLDRNQLQIFRDVYGATAFVCRYLNCSIERFQSSLQRDKHESQHRQRYHCSHSSCIYAVTGFTTANLLRKHIEKYHSAIADSGSLVDMLSVPHNTISRDSNQIPRNNEQNPDISDSNQIDHDYQLPAKPMEHDFGSSDSETLALTQNELEKISAMAMQKLFSTSEQDKQNIRISIYKKFPQVIQKAQQSGMDMAFICFRNQIKGSLQREKLRVAAAQQQQQQQQGQNNLGDDMDWQSDKPELRVRGSVEGGFLPHHQSSNGLHPVDGSPPHNLLTTDKQNPFVNHAGSPQGSPIYSDLLSSMTRDSLLLPKNKRQRLDSNASSQT